MPQNSAVSVYFLMLYVSFGVGQTYRTVKVKPTDYCRSNLLISNFSIRGVGQTYLLSLMELIFAQKYFRNLVNYLRGIYLMPWTHWVYLNLMNIEWVECKVKRCLRNCSGVINASLTENQSFPNGWCLSILARLNTNSRLRAETQNSNTCLSCNNRSRNRA